MYRKILNVTALVLIAGCATTPPPADGPGGADPAPSGTPTSEPPSAPSAGQTSRTIWDGVYTAAQAREGERVAQSQCTLCHTPQIEWPLVIESWSNRPLIEMWEMIHNTMPQTNPGGLTREEYSDIVAYMLQLAGAPSGAQELPSGADELAQIQVTRRNQ